MSYLLEPRDEKSFRIVNADAAFAMGHVHLQGGRYHVSCVVSDDEVDVAVVKSLNEAIPAFVAYFVSHPPRWEPTDQKGWVITGPVAQRDNAPRYTKSTDFALMRVEREQSARWVASRDDYPLLRDGKPATFATREEAQHVADLHEREGYPHSEPINDGYTWPIDPDTQEWLAARGRWPKPVNAAAIAV
jgi:hypothetical protein